MPMQDIIMEIKKLFSFTFVSLHKQLNGVVIPNSLSIDSLTCSAFFCSTEGAVQPII